MYIARWKISAIVKLGKQLRLDSSLVRPKPITQAVSLEKFCSYELIHENYVTFPPWNNLQYTVCYL